MSRLVLSSAVTVVSVLLAGACGSDGGSTAEVGSPETAVTRLLTALEDGSCSDVRALVVTPDLVDCEAIADLQGGYAADGVDLDDVKASSSEVVDDSSTVTVDLGGDEAKQTWQAERVDGSWKVLFDSEE